MMNTNFCSYILQKSFESVKKGNVCKIILKNYKLVILITLVVLVLITCAGK